MSELLGIAVESFLDKEGQDLIQKIVSELVIT